MTISTKSIQTISGLEVNRTYKIAFDSKGEIVSLETTGTGKVVKGKRVEPLSLGEHDKAIVDAMLASVNTGSMVIAFTQENGQLKVASQIGKGNIKYAKKIISAHYGLEVVIAALKQLASSLGSDFSIVVRHKRRANRWEVYAGMYTPQETIEGYVPSKDNPFKVYNLATRSHLWEEKVGE